MNHSDLNNPAAEFQFELPGELIAQCPPQERTASRMLLVDGKDGIVGDRQFSVLPTVLKPGDLLVINESRVMEARLYTRRCDTGGKIELLLVEPDANEGTWLAMARPTRRIRPGVKLEILAAPDKSRGETPTGQMIEVTAILGGGEILVRADRDLYECARRWGVMPLPPYIHRDFQNADDLKWAVNDRVRYQTVYATEDPQGRGSVAAPTAGLHFTEDLLSELSAQGINISRVRLHVGPGTFRPPDAEQIRSRRLHPERFTFPASLWEQLQVTRANGGRVVAVGTTSLRVLETVARLNLAERTEPRVRFEDTSLPDPVFVGEAIQRPQGWEVSGTTRLFIMPPDTIQAADGLLTNFHLPGSSLLMLVASLLEPGVWRPIYQEAVNRKMRFYSYGDCMLAFKSGRRFRGC